MKEFYTTLTEAALSDAEVPYWIQSVNGSIQAVQMPGHITPATKLSRIHAVLMLHANADTRSVNPEATAKFTEAVDAVLEWWRTKVNPPVSGTGITISQHLQRL